MKININTEIAQFHSCDEPLYWHGCYGSDKAFKKYITPESYAHPAKMSFLLCERIFKHLEKLGLLRKNDVVCDFMSGSGRTNIIASLRGYNSIAMELEPHFIKMIQDNVTLTKKQINRNVNVKIIQGDARHLSEILTEQAVGIVSPPFLDSTLTKDKKFIKKIEIEKRHGSRFQGGNIDGYSSNLQNIGNLRDKNIVGITSPPYAHESTPTKKNKWQEEHNWKSGHQTEVNYTEDDYRFKENKMKGNIGKTKIFRRVPCSAGDPEAKHDKRPERKGTEWEWTKEVEIFIENMVGITSPPYAHDSVMSPNQQNPLIKEKFHNIPYSNETIDFESRRNPKTGRFDAHQFKNIGRMKDSDLPEGQESYLSAMLQVYQEAAKTMPVLVTITKNPTRNSKLRRLDLDTAKLLMLAGYKIIDYHRAILFEERKQ